MKIGASSQKIGRAIQNQLLKTFGLENDFCKPTFASLKLCWGGGDEDDDKAFDEAEISGFFVQTEPFNVGAQKYLVKMRSRPCVNICKMSVRYWSRCLLAVRTKLSLLNSRVVFKSLSFLEFFLFSYKVNVISYFPFHCLFT